MGNLKKHIFWLSVFMTYSLLLWLTDKYIFQYFEQQQTFFADSCFIAGILGRIGGGTILLSDLIIQFFICPAIGILITALFLTLMSFISFEIFYCISSKRDPVLLSLLPGIGCAFQMYCADFQYSNMVSMLIMVLALWVYVKIGNVKRRLEYGIVSSLVLFAFSGAVSSLFAISVILIELSSNVRHFWKFLFVPGIIVAAYSFAINVGAIPDIKCLAGPYTCYELQVGISNITFLSWGLWVAVLSMACVRPFIKNTGNVFSCCFLAVQMVGIIGLGYLGEKVFANSSDVFFRELNQIARNGEWDRMIKRYEKRPADNLLFQNYLSVALAEEGRLADEAFDHNFKNIRSIYVEPNKSPSVSNLLGDVFFSMGELGLAMRYYFEFNESVGNYSPVCLQKLALINLAYGAYGVAGKYLSLLGKTLFYKGWAKRYTKLLKDDAAIAGDPMVGPLRKCIFADNKLSGLGGLDIDLKCIVRANPERFQTMQYLGTLLLLMKDIDSFMSLMEEFYGSVALNGSLPYSFQQAVCVFADGDKEILDKYNISDEMIFRFKTFRHETYKERQGFWDFYYDL